MPLATAGVEEGAGTEARVGDAAAESPAALPPAAGPGAGLAIGMGARLNAPNPSSFLENSDLIAQEAGERRTKSSRQR